MTPFFRSLPLLTLPFAALPTIADAQEAPGRYQIAPTPSGVVRLDTQTGALTLCRDEGDLLACTDKANARALGAKETEADTIRALEARIAALEKAVKQRDDTQKSSLPDQAEIDRSLSIMEQMMRRFMGMAQDLSRERPGSEPYPNKT